MKTGKIKSFFPGKKVKLKKAQLFPTIFLMKIMKKSPVKKLNYIIAYILYILLYSTWYIIKVFKVALKYFG